MTRRITSPALLFAFLALVAAACSTAPARFYTLDSTAASQPAPLAGVAVLIGPVSVPEAVDRPEFVVQVASNQVEIEEFNRWAAPLNDSIARAVAGDLSAQLGTPHVAVAPMANFIPTYLVTIDVQRFDSIRGQGVVVEAVWAVSRIPGGAKRSGRTVARETVQGDGFDALAAAHSRALAKVSADIAETIRAENGETQ
jgi:uncharacterized lipoprotein YmbA